MFYFWCPYKAKYSYHFNYTVFIRLINRILTVSRKMPRTINIILFFTDH